MRAKTAAMFGDICSSTSITSSVRSLGSRASGRPRSATRSGVENVCAIPPITSSCSVVASGATSALIALNRAAGSSSPTTAWSVPTCSSCSIVPMRAHTHDARCALFSSARIVRSVSARMCVVAAAMRLLSAPSATSSAPNSMPPSAAAASASSRAECGPDIFAKASSNAFNCASALAARALRRRWLEPSASSCASRLASPASACRLRVSEPKAPAYPE
mmetsp:Transcript_17351/g.53906  ORF Transcript_17351/g.53906 Transcript_17351/m.53906 type:complete len:219 (-) Transcript_17351:341-997(-)